MRWQRRQRIVAICCTRAPISQWLRLPLLPLYHSPPHFIHCQPVMSPPSPFDVCLQRFKVRSQSISISISVSAFYFFGYLSASLKQPKTIPGKKTRNCPLVIAVGKQNGILTLFRISIDRKLCAFKENCVFRKYKIFLYLLYELKSHLACFIRACRIS